MRFSQLFGENVLRYGSHECLPYSKNAPCSQIFKHQFVVLMRSSDKHFSKLSRRDTIIVNCQFGEAVQTVVFLLGFGAGGRLEKNLRYGEKVG